MNAGIFPGYLEWGQFCNCSMEYKMGRLQECSSLWVKAS